MGLFWGLSGMFGSGTGCSSSWLLLVGIHSSEWCIRTLWEQGSAVSVGLVQGRVCCLGLCMLEEGMGHDSLGGVRGHGMIFEERGRGMIFAEKGHDMISEVSAADMLEEEMRA